MVADFRSAADLSQAFQDPAVAGGGALRTGALVRWIEREWGFFRKRKIQPHHDQQLGSPNDSVNELLKSNVSSRIAATLLLEYPNPGSSSASSINPNPRCFAQIHVPESAEFGQWGIA